MARFTRVLFLFLLLNALGLVLEATPGGPASRDGVAFAQSTPEGLSKLEGKVNDIAALVTKILYVFVGLGILFCGFRFIQGDPHAWKYTITVVVGATIIFASGEILTWLQR